MAGDTGYTTLAPASSGVRKPQVCSNMWDSGRIDSSRSFRPNGNTAARPRAFEAGCGG